MSNMSCWLHSTNCRSLAIRFKEDYNAFKTNSGQSKFTTNILEHHLFMPMKNIMNIVSKISKRKALLTPQWTSWTLPTGKYFLILYIGQISHHQTSIHSPKTKTIFMFCASKLMKMSRRTRHFNSEARTMWSTAIITASAKW